MVKQDVKVKSYVRKGKLVKQYQRKQDSALVKATIVTASTLGLTAASYLLLKRRYIGNLDKAAKSIKVNPNVGIILKNNIDDITFTIGGFAYGKDVNQSAIKQAEGLATGIKKNIPPNVRKNIQFIALDHKFKVDSLDKSKPSYYSKLIQKVSEPFFRGRNDESIKLAEEIYSWHVKNPTKRISIVGYSAGGNMARDIQYILNKRGIKVKVATIGTSDFKLLPTKNDLNIMGDKDGFKKLRAPNSVVIPNVNSHRLDAYLTDADTRSKVTKPIIKHLFNN
jgi:hypothetical protein